MISVRLSGQQRVLRRLQNARKDFSTIVEDIHLDEWMLKRVLDRFRRGVSPDGGAWPELLPQTIARKKRARAVSMDPLVRTGRLFKAIDIIIGSRDGLFAVNTGLNARIGVTDPEASEYGRVHNTGLYSGQIKRKQKKRRFLGLSPLDVRAVRELLRRRAREILEG